mgnify:CR=1 FL=1
MIDGWHVDQVDRRTFPPENTTMNLKTENQRPALRRDSGKFSSEIDLQGPSLRPDAKTQNTTRLNLT